MTLEQSSKNIRLLKNFIWPVDFENEIHFNFTSETAFTISFEKHKSEAILGGLENYTTKSYPLALYSFNTFGHLTMSYHDKNIYYYEVNFTTGKEYSLYWDEVKRTGLRSIRQKKTFVQMFERIKSKILWN